MTVLLPSIYLLLLVSLCPGTEIQRLEFKKPAKVERAEIYSFKAVPHPQAVLILCPGCNGAGKGLVSNPVWQQYARDHHLGLMGLSFASPLSAIQKGDGYYIASAGSGQVLLDAVREVYDQTLPILIFGFSGGALRCAKILDHRIRE